MPVIEVQPDKDRYDKTEQKLLRAAETVLKNVERPVGYVVMAWDDRGGTSIAAVQGGPISWDLLPLHAMTQIMRITLDK